MRIKPRYIVFVFILISVSLFAQEKEENKDPQKEELNIQVEKKTKKRRKKKRARKVRPYEPLAPARAAFYSAVLPGLGQVYTRKYWKVPIVYAALGTGIYFYKQNNDNFNRVRDAFKNRLAGRPDEFTITDPDTGIVIETVTDEGLVSLQQRFRREQELSLLITAGLYLLNILDANVTAHLQQYNLNKDLTFNPQINFSEFDNKPNFGVSLNYNF